MAPLSSVAGAWNVKVKARGAGRAGPQILFCRRGECLKEGEPGLGTISFAILKDNCGSWRMCRREAGSPFQPSSCVCHPFHF